MYKDIEALYDAIESDKERSYQLTLFLDGGDAIINNDKGETVFEDNERKVLKDLISLFLGIKYEEI